MSAQTPFTIQQIASFFVNKLTILLTNYVVWLH